MNILIALLIAQSSYAGGAATNDANAAKCAKAGDASVKECSEVPLEKPEVQPASDTSSDPTGLARYEAMEGDLSYVLDKLKFKQDKCVLEKGKCEKECDRLAGLHPQFKQIVDSAKASNCTGPMDGLIAETQGNYTTTFQNRAKVQRSIACLNAGNPSGCE